eukprot:11176818-Lingulodinium_polyedra.AAC.1
MAHLAEATQSAPSQHEQQSVVVGTPAAPCGTLPSRLRRSRQVPRQLTSRGQPAPQRLNRGLARSSPRSRAGSCRWRRL